MLCLVQCALADSCREVLLGSLSGALHEVTIDEKDKKEKLAKRVFQLQDSKDPISSVYQHQAPQGQRMVLMATSKCLYVFSGKGGLELMFARYTSPGNMSCHLFCNEHCTLQNPAPRKLTTLHDRLAE